MHSNPSDGQVTLEAHHASARKILLVVQQQLDLLETGRDTSIELQAEISQRLNSLSREVQTIEELLPYAASDKRKVWGRRVQQLKDDQRVVKVPYSQQPMRPSTQKLATCSGLLSESTRRTLAAWVPNRGCDGAPLPAQSRQSHCLLAIQDDSRRESAALAKYATQQYNQQREVEEREALLHRRSNSAADSHAISIDALQKESQSLSSAHRSIVK